jgi:hypothetical protein
MSKTRTKHREFGMTCMVAALAVSLLLGTIAVQAADVILDNDDNVIRVNNLELNLDQDEFDGPYDAEFINGTGVDIFGSEDNFDFPLAEDHATAMLQLTRALNDNIPVPKGATSAGSFQFFTPAIEYFNLWAAFGAEFKFGGEWGDCDIDCLPGGVAVLQPDDLATYVKFTPSDAEPPPSEPEPDDRLIDLVTLGDVGGSGDVDLAVLDVALDGNSQLSATVHVRDGGTGNEIYQTTLNNDWRSLAIDTLVGNSGPLLAILQRKNDGTIRVHVLDASNGTVVGNYQYFDSDWTPIDILSVSDAGGPGIAGIGVLAENPAGKQAIEVRKAGNGAVVERVFYFNDVWSASDAVDLGEFNGNGRSEMSVLATNNAGKHAVETRDLLSGKQISRHFFLGPTNTVIGLADSADVDSNGRPELIVLGNKDANNNSANTAQTKDVKTGALISKPGSFAPPFVGFAIRSMDDANGNSSPEMVIGANSGTDNSTRVQVRDVANGMLTLNTSILSPAYDPRDLEILDDVSGNAIQELVAAGLDPDTLAIRVQLRDGQDGTLLLNIDID